MYWYPYPFRNYVLMPLSFIISNEGMKLKMWRALKPLALDKLCLVSLKGVIKSAKRKRSMNVFIQMLGFHILIPFAKQTTNGRITASHVSVSDAGGGGRKGFQDFGRFSKCMLKCPNSRIPLAMIRSTNLSCNVFIFRSPPLTRPWPDTSLVFPPTLIYVDILKMTVDDLSSVDSIFGIVDTMDFYYSFNICSA